MPSSIQNNGPLAPTSKSPNQRLGNRDSTSEALTSMGMLTSEDSGGLEVTAFVRAVWMILIGTLPLVCFQSSANSKYWLGLNEVESKPARSLSIRGSRLMFITKASNIEGSIGIGSSNYQTNRK